MKRKLSSDFTPLYKLVFPGLWCGLAAYTLVEYGFMWGDSTLKNFLGACIFWVGGGILVFFVGARLKVVYLEDDALCVSNYLKKVRIPLESISTVKRSRFWTTINKVVVTVSCTTAFGKRIEFSPASGASQVIDQLKSQTKPSSAYHR